MHRGPSFFFAACSKDLRIRRGLFALLALTDNDKGLRNKAMESLYPCSLTPDGIAFGMKSLVVYQWCEAALPRGAKGYTSVSEQRFFYVGAFQPLTLLTSS